MALTFDYDIAVAGGGLAGMIAAAGFAEAGFTVLCVDPAPPITDRDAKGADLRTTALLQPSRDFLAEIGLWDRLAPFAAPLQVMRIVDAGGVQNTPRSVKDFDAADIGDRPFGWNLSNWLLRREFSEHLETLDAVDLRFGTGLNKVQTRSQEARVRLSDGSRHRVRLVIAADGRGSQVRHDAGIDARTTRYGQKALAFAVTHPVPHEQISTEIHRSGGPFTLVPLPDYDGQPSSAVVWMERSAEAKRLHALPKDAFDRAATERSCHLLGPLSLVSQRTIWPIITQMADRFNGERIALIAEAAHVMPPIGAQGLNTSIGDVRKLRQLCLETPEDLGAAGPLARYNRARWPEVQFRSTGIDALNRASMTEAQGLRDLRKLGLESLYGVAPVRKALMRTGLGAMG